MKVALTTIGRYGDTIAVSIIANMITAAGHTVKWLTSRPYLDLAAATTSGAEIGVHPAFEDKLFSGKVTTDSLKGACPGCDVYVNAQFGASEDSYLKARKHPLHWLREKVERLSGIRLGSDWRSHLVYRNPRPVRLACALRAPLAIIAPETISSRPALSPEKISKIYGSFKDRGFDTRLLVPSKPKVPGRYEYIFGHSFVDAVKILQMASHYVGQDTGLSWAALYSGCSKEVYHSRERFRIYKTSFAKIDPSVVEHVV